jgi:hypothetical protein
MAKYPEYEMKQSMKAGGDGWPTAEELIAVLRTLPPHAKPDFRRHDSQREGTSWTLTAEWDVAIKPDKPGTFNHHNYIHHAPGETCRCPR